MSNEQQASAKEIICRILDDTEFILDEFGFVPETDKNGDLVQAKVELSLLLTDKQEGSKSAKQVLDEYTLGEDETLENMLEDSDTEIEEVEPKKSEEE